MELGTLLATQGLMEQAPTRMEIRERGSNTEDPLKIFYGETYDEAGTPVDSLKYYLFVAELSEAIRNEGYDTEPTILVADTAVSRNVGPNQQDRFERLGDERYHSVIRANEVYNTGLNVVRMSDFIDEAEFRTKRNKIIDFCHDNPSLIQEVEKTVPESKLEIEREKGFLYSYDEIATIIDLDLKVGPPREDLYDEVARKIANAEGKNPLMSLYLRPTFPVGKNWAYFFNNEGIEDHGITAYKAASKRLQDNRIILGRTSPENATELINGSHISSNPRVPNPVLDLGIIAELARKRIEGDKNEIDLPAGFYNGEISSEELKKEVADKLSKFVLAYF